MRLKAPHLALLASMLLTTAACDATDDPALPVGFEPTLQPSGCSDMLIHAANGDGSVGLALWTGSEFRPVAAAVEAGTTTTTEHDVSEFERLSILVGSNVTYPECNDAIEVDAYEIEQEWVAVAGTVTIEIEPELGQEVWDTQGHATVTITGLQVEYDGLVDSVDDLTFTDVAVGWLPG